MDYDCEWICQKKLNVVNLTPLIREFCNRFVVNKNTAYGILLNYLSELRILLLITIALNNNVAESWIVSPQNQMQTHKNRFKQIHIQKSSLSLSPQSHKHYWSSLFLIPCKSQLYFSDPKEERKFSTADCKREGLGTFTSCPF